MRGLCIRVSFLAFILAVWIEGEGEDRANGNTVVEASRTILFDIHSRIGLNLGILFAWAAVNTVLFPVCCYFMRWKTMKAKNKEAESKDE